MYGAFMLQENTPNLTRSHDADQITPDHIMGCLTPSPQEASVFFLNFSCPFSIPLQGFLQNPISCGLLCVLAFNLPKLGI